ARAARGDDRAVRPRRSAAQGVPRSAHRAERPGDRRGHLRVRAVAGDRHAEGRARRAARKRPLHDPARPALPRARGRPRAPRARRGWDVALVQEALPRWVGTLGRAAEAGAVCALTSRNFGLPLRAALARLNPDLMASNEGGSNQLLVRAPWRVTDVIRLTLAQRPERRTMLFASLEGPGERELAVANLHASAGDPPA